MRNYVKLRCLRIYPYTPPNSPDPNFFYVCFGNTDDDLFKYQQRIFQQTAQPGQLYQTIEDQLSWWELDVPNFVIFINQNSGQFWTQTHLNDRFAPIPNSELLYDQTTVGEQGSPRKTWSHGH